MKKLIFIRLFLLMAVVLVYSLTFAQEIQIEEKAAAYKYQYVIKFICGKSDGKILAKGDYYTAINVYHPISPVVQPKIFKKFAIAEPKETPGKTSNLIPMNLPYDKALEIDCQNIRDHLIKQKLITPGRLFVKGFAIIWSTVPLDVVAVYTAAGLNGEVRTLDIERVLSK